MGVSTLYYCSRWRTTTSRDNQQYTCCSGLGDECQQAGHRLWVATCQHQPVEAEAHSHAPETGKVKGRGL